MSMVTVIRLHARGPMVTRPWIAASSLFLLAGTLLFAQSQPARPAPLPVDVVVKSPAETDTELQVICLFRSDPSNTLHGSLLEMDEKLAGLLQHIRASSPPRGAPF